MRVGTVSSPILPLLLLNTTEASFIPSQFRSATSLTAPNHTTHALSFRVELTGSNQELVDRVRDGTDFVPMSRNSGPEQAFVRFVRSGEIESTNILTEDRSSSKGFSFCSHEFIHASSSSSIPTFVVPSLSTQSRVSDGNTAEPSNRQVVPGSNTDFNVLTHPSDEMRDARRSDELTRTLIAVNLYRINDFAKKLRQKQSKEWLYSTGREHCGRYSPHAS
nr:hypothetical protein CFP56_20240 [Quercus suber]